MSPFAYPIQRSSADTRLSPHSSASLGLALFIALALAPRAQVETLTVADTHLIPARVFLLQPDVLLVADNNIVSVVDVGALPDLSEIALADVSDDVQGLARNGEYIYAALGEPGVAVLRFDLFGNIEHLRTIAELSFARRLAVDGDRLYAAAGQVGILIADISDPANPSLIGAPHLFFSPSYIFNGEPREARLSVDDLAILPAALVAVGQEITVPADSGPATFDFGLRTLQPSDTGFFTLSARPTPTADTRLALSANRVLFGGRLAVGGSFEDGGFATADLSSPNDPPVAPQITDTGLLKVHDLRQGLAWISYQSSSTSPTLRGWDVADPAAPVLRAEFLNTLPIQDVVVREPYILLGDEDSIHVLNRPAAFAAIPPVTVFEPAATTTTQPGRFVTVGWQTNRAVAGDTVRIILVKSGLEVAELGVDQSPNGENSAQFEIPPVPSGSDYRIRARSLANPVLAADAPVTISITGGITETAVEAGRWLGYE